MPNMRHAHRHTMMLAAAAAVLVAVPTTVANATSPIPYGARVSTGPDVTGWTGISISSSHACARRIGGSVWCWGFNGDGDLGDGSTTDRHVPTRALGGNHWSTVSSGAQHTCALKDDHSVWCWGANNYGQLGVEDPSNHLTPTRLPGPANWASVVSGAGFTCGIRLDQSLWCWGNNVNGQLGDGTTTNRFEPVPVGGPNDQWASVAPGEYFTCAISTTRALYCWGDNEHGQLGTGDKTEQHLPVQIEPGTTWNAVATGDWIFEAHTCAINAATTLWCWGSNDSGELGSGDHAASLTPEQVGDRANWVTVGAGGYHSCASRVNATLWCWGANSSGQLGIGSTFAQLRPTQVGARRVWTTVTTGLLDTCSLRGNAPIASMWCWGWNQYGNVGDGTTIDRVSPVRLRVPPH